MSHQVHHHAENLEEGNTTPHWNGEHGADQWIIENKEINQTIHISAKYMHILWGNDHRFWHWINLSKDESPFEVAAEIVQVNWMEVNCSLELEKFKLTPSTRYEIIYKIKFNMDAFGWETSPVIFELTTPGEHGSKKTEVMLKSHVKKRNEWHEVHCGEFSLHDSKGKLKFCISEVDPGRWKGGMIFEGVIIRPKLV